ncbi:MAG: DUF2971 domain-containing protein [Tissierellia bacterium]|nr:DUF2971 domain-containing protein [Tissierellia bacterium]
MSTYNNGQIPRIDDGFLYHFTTADSLMKIVENMTLKLSSFTFLNDLNEDELSCESSGGMDAIHIRNFIRQNCRLICFTQNFESEGNSSCHTGCNHPRMWDQYADNSKGACIVINEKEFLKRNHKILESKFYKIDNVRYSLSLYNKDIKTQEDEKMFIMENYDHLFFKKYIDWGQEHERRFFGIDLPDFLSIKGCIEFICLGRRFSNENLLKLVHLIVMPGHESYLQLTPHDFAIQFNSNGSVKPHDWAGRILETVKQSNSDTSKYLKYLKENGYAISDLC